MILRYLAGKNLKPYQGLKQELEHSAAAAAEGRAGKNLKPYQGLKLTSVAIGLPGNRRKKPKTLSGIETSTSKCHTFDHDAPEKT